MTANRLLKALILCPVFLLMTQILSAQNKLITGKILDEKGNPVIGASVVVKGGKNGTTTDATGHFTLNAPTATTTVVVSYVGYAPQDLDVSTNGDVSVTLQPTNTSLSDIVVVGYGTTRKKDLTGSVAAITTKDFNKGVIATPEQMIQGRTPGVTITPSSGEPGASTVINIRGSASIRGNQEPLYVVDGVPLGGGGTVGTNSGVEGTSSPKNPLIFLNPADIESITILKDASSAAIYGSRGANGVVLITTKSGKGRGAFQFSGSTGLSKVSERYDLMNGPDFLNAVVNANVLAGLSREDAENNVKLIDKGANTDWQDVIYRTGVSQSYNLAYGFSHKLTTLRLSAAYDDIQGIIENTGLKRMTGRANFTQKFFGDRLKLDGNFLYSNTKNSYAPLTNNAGYQGSLVGAVISFNPTYPILDSTGAFFDPKDGNRNPAEMLAYFDDKDDINRYLGNATFTLKLFTGLSYKLVLGLDQTSGLRTSYADPRISTAMFSGTSNVFGYDLKNPIQGNGRATRQVSNITSYLVEHYLTYDKVFNNSVLNAVAGFSYQSFESDYRNTIAWGVPNPVVRSTDVFIKDWHNFTNYYLDIPYYEKSELQSFYGRVNYSFHDKYFLTGTVRSDGSTKFGENNRYGVFPAFAAKWRILNEGFSEGFLTNIFKDLSLRANYGLLGSQDGLGAYYALNQQTTYLTNDNNGVYKNVTSLNWAGNPDLKWEQATTTGVGVDFTLAGLRLSGTIDYYYTQRKNVLFYGPTPGGFAPSSNWWINLPGFVINSGVEFSLNYTAIKSQKFTWEINYNMTFMHNDVKDLNQIVNTGSVNGQGLSGAYAQTITDGYPLFTWKMPVFDGYDKDGFAIYADGGKDHLLGTALPDFTAGLTNTFTYDRLSLSLFFNAVTGFYVYNNTANALLLKGSIKNGRNVTYEAANSPENPINPGSVSTRFLEKGDFVRFSNASLSYAFNIENNATVKSFSVFVTGQNLALFSNYSGLDPEVNVDHSINGYPSRGFDYTAYPRPRTVTFGVSVGF